MLTIPCFLVFLASAVLCPAAAVALNAQRNITNVDEHRATRNATSPCDSSCLRRVLYQTSYASAATGASQVMVTYNAFSWCAETDWCPQVMNSTLSAIAATAATTLSVDHDNCDTACLISALDVVSCKAALESMIWAESIVNTTATISSYNESSALSHPTPVERLHWTMWTLGRCEPVVIDEHKLNFYMKPPLRLMNVPAPYSNLTSTRTELQPSASFRPSSTTVNVYPVAAVAASSDSSPTISSEATLTTSSKSHATALAFIGPHALAPLAPFVHYKPEHEESSHKSSNPYHGHSSHHHGGQNDHDGGDDDDDDHDGLLGGILGGTLGAVGGLVGGAVGGIAAYPFLHSAVGAAKDLLPKTRWLRYLMDSVPAPPTPGVAAPVPVAVPISGEPVPVVVAGEPVPVGNPGEAAPAPVGSVPDTSPIREELPLSFNDWSSNVGDVPQQEQIPPENWKPTSLISEIPANAPDAQGHEPDSDDAEPDSYERPEEQRKDQDRKEDEEEDQADLPQEIEWEEDGDPEVSPTEDSDDESDEPWEPPEEKEWVEGSPVVSPANSDDESEEPWDPPEEKEWVEGSPVVSPENSDDEDLPAAESEEADLPEPQREPDIPPLSEEQEAELAKPLNLKKLLRAEKYNPKTGVLEQQTLVSAPPVWQLDALKAHSLITNGYKPYYMLDPEGRVVQKDDSFDESIPHGGNPKIVYERPGDLKPIEGTWRRVVKANLLYVRRPKGVMDSVQPTRETKLRFNDQVKYRLLDAKGRSILNSDGLQDLVDYKPDDVEVSTSDGAADAYESDTPGKQTVGASTDNLHGAQTVDAANAGPHGGQAVDALKDAPHDAQTNDAPQSGQHAENTENEPEDASDTTSPEPTTAHTFSPVHTEMTPTTISPVPSPIISPVQSAPKGGALTGSLFTVAPKPVSTERMAERPPPASSMRPVSKEGQFKGSLHTRPAKSAPTHPVAHRPSAASPVTRRMRTSTHIEPSRITVTVTKERSPTGSASMRSLTSPSPSAVRIASTQHPSTLSTKTTSKDKPSEGPLATQSIAYSASAGRHPSSKRHSTLSPSTVLSSSLLTLASPTVSSISRPSMALTDLPSRTLRDSFSTTTAQNADPLTESHAAVPSPHWFFPYPGRRYPKRPNPCKSGKKTKDKKAEHRKNKDKKNGHSPYGPVFDDIRTPNWELDGSEWDDCEDEGGMDQDWRKWTNNPGEHPERHAKDKKNGHSPYGPIFDDIRTPEWEVNHALPASGMDPHLINKHCMPKAQADQFMRDWGFSATPKAARKAMGKECFIGGWPFDPRRTIPDHCWKKYNPVCLEV